MIAFFTDPMIIAALVGTIGMTALNYLASRN